jgi:PAS domain S-box-containing protein
MVTTNNFEYTIISIENTLQQVLLSQSETERQVLIETALNELNTLRNIEQKTATQLNDYNTAPCGYYTAHEDGTIIRMNDTMLKWLGYSREEVIRIIRPVDFILNTETAYAQEQRDKFKQNSMLQEAEYLVKRKNGSTFSAVFNAVAIKDDIGDTLEIRIAVFDITEHKALENELKVTTEQLYQANDAKNKFIGIASHDLQNPITAVSMSTELLKKTIAHATPIQQKLLGNIKSAADRMNYLVSNILSINRIERGMVSDDWRTVHLKSLVWDIVNRNQIFAQRKNIYIHQFADDTTDWRILTEPNYLTQAVENILSNAIKFSHKNKNITIELHRRGDEMDILIEDEGQGMKAEEMPRLFGRFQKLSARPTGNEISTGLGLSVAKEFVDVLRGRISVKSIWEIGTTFTVTLPIVPIFETS